MPDTIYNLVDEGDPLLLRSRLIPLSKLNELNKKRWLLHNKRTRITGFYESQNKHIARLLNPLSDPCTTEEENINDNRMKKKRRMLLNLTFTATLIISAMQLYSAIVSRSSSLGLITVDSIIDVFAGVAIKYTDSKIKNVELRKYPCVSIYHLSYPDFFFFQLPYNFN